MDSLENDLCSKIEELSKDVRLERLKQAHCVSQGLQNLSSTFTDSFETDLREFEAKNCIWLGQNNTVERSDQQERKKSKVTDEMEEAIFHAEKTMSVKYKLLKNVWEE